MSTVSPARFLVDDKLTKLNLGCGGDPLPDFINLDIRPGRHVDCVFNLELCGKIRLPFKPDTFTHMQMIHCFEHITNVLPMMQELWRIAAPGCQFVLATPYGSSDNADEDPTHVRRIFADTFTYFSQSYYGRNDYGYRGDWMMTKRVYRIKRSKAHELMQDALQDAIDERRNMVDEFRVTLEAVKPLRRAGFPPLIPDTRYELTDG